jgi:ABC-type sugar transport system substrate-binding protein
MSTRIKLALFFAWVAMAGAMCWSCGKQGCGSGPGGSQRDKASDGAAYSVTYSSVGDPNPWFETFTRQMEREAIKRGYAFTVVHAEAKVDKQIADVEELVSRKPDILILGPIDVKASAPCLDIAKKAGVPVIVVNRDIAGQPGKDYVTRIYSDFEWIGAKQAELIAKALGPDKPIKIVELHGTPGGGNTIGLSKGFREEMKKHPNMEIIDSELGNYDRLTALASMKNVIEKLGGSFNAVFGHADVEGVAAIQSLKAKGFAVGDGRNNSIVVVSNSGLKEAIKAIKAGDLYATVTVSPYYANQVFDAVDDFRSGKTLPPYIRVEDFIIDTSNVAQYESFAY